MSSVIHLLHIALTISVLVWNYVWLVMLLEDLSEAMSRFRAEMHPCAELMLPSVFTRAPEFQSFWHVFLWKKYDNDFSFFYSGKFDLVKVASCTLMVALKGANISGGYIYTIQKNCCSLIFGYLM